MKTYAPVIAYAIPQCSINHAYVTAALLLKMEKAAASGSVSFGAGSGTDSNLPTPSPLIKVRIYGLSVVAYPRKS